MPLPPAPGQPTSSHPTGRWGRPVYLAVPCSAMHNTPSTSLNSSLQLRQVYHNVPEWQWRPIMRLATGRLNLHCVTAHWHGAGRSVSDCCPLLCRLFGGPGTLCFRVPRPWRLLSAVPCPDASGCCGSSQWGAHSHAAVVQAHAFCSSACQLPDQDPAAQVCSRWDGLDGGPGG